MKRALLLCILLASCKSTEIIPRTEVLLQIEAERLVKLSADHLTVEIASGPSGGTLMPGAPEEFDLTSDDFNWPASLALVAQAGHEDHVFDITINIEANDKRVARSRVKSSFIKHQTLLLKTLLYGECLGNLECSGSQTCVAPEGKARCDSADVDASTLPQFSPSGSGGQSAAQGGETGAGSGAGAGAAVSGSGGRGGRGATGSGGSGQSGTSGAGMQDAGKPPGDGGASECEPSGPEQCDNGADDDCNGYVDCADPVCTDMQCVPNDRLAGVLVPESSACPSGYDSDEPQLVHRGLSDPGCGGCSCEPVPITCTPQAYFYGSTSECTADIAPFGRGTAVTDRIPPKAECSPLAIGASIGMSNPAGWRVRMTQSADSCRAGGTPELLPPTWSNTMKLCVITAERNGCGPGRACVPKVGPGKKCAQRQGSSCPAATSLQTWQLDYLDERSCGSCDCAARGGSCSALLVSLARSSGTVPTAGTGGLGGTGGAGRGGSGGAGAIGGAGGIAAAGRGGAGAIGGTGGFGGTLMTAGTGAMPAPPPITTLGGCEIVDSSLQDGEKSCLLTTYYPTAYWEGVPLNPTCTANAAVSGSVKPSDPLELCCAD